MTVASLAPSNTEELMKSTEKLSFSNRDVYIVTASLKPKAGGRTSSLIRRAKLLTDCSDEKISICSIAYDPNYIESLRELVKQKKINSQISIENVYDDLMEDPVPKARVEHKKEDDGYSVVERDGHRYVHYKQGVKSHIKDFDKKTGRLGHINHYEQGFEQVTARTHFDNLGAAHRKDIFSKSTTTLLQQIYLDRSGTPYLIKNFDTSQTPPTLASIIYLGGKLGTARQLPHFEALCTFWLNSKIKRKTVFIGDARITDPAILDIDNTLAAKVFQFHGNYHTQPEKLSSAYIDRLQPLLSNIEKADAIIALTDSQAEDFASHFPTAKEKVRCISHSIEPLPLTYKKDVKSICVMARLVKVKRVDHVIRAFALMNEIMPGYTLNIYGDGADREKFESLISTLGLEKFCLLKGHTSEPFKAFQESFFTVVSSHSEGFCLSVLESLANGTPVVSYDINFGPRDMIIDGTNGFLANNGSIEALSESMMKMANKGMDTNPLTVQSTIEKFGNAKFASKWFAVINSV